MNVPNYITTLLQPQATKPVGRKVWSVDLETGWIPFFLATNAVQATAIPSDALGAPLRLAYDKDGEVKFTKSGRPSLKVATEVAAQVRIVRENFVANLATFVGQVKSKSKTEYAAEVEAANKAAEPIIAKTAYDLELAIQRMKECADAEAEKAKAEATPESESTPEPEKVPVTA